LAVSYATNLPAPGSGYTNTCSAANRNPNNHADANPNPDTHSNTLLHAHATTNLHALANAHKPTDAHTYTCKLTIFRDENSYEPKPSAVVRQPSSIWNSVHEPLRMHND
jgi:hypothetical protein